MIARIDKVFISSLEPKWVAILVATIAKGNHLIDCDNETRQIIENCVDNHCGTIDKEIVLNASLYEITKIKREYLTTIQVDGSFSVHEYLNLFGKPSLVLMENAPYEWPVYNYMIDAYKHDKQFQTIFKILQKAISGPERTLQEFGAGGNGGIVISLKQKESTPEYSGLTRYKIFTVTDSDLDAVDGPYRPTPKSIFQHLSGPTYKNSPVDRRLIDTLNQPHYHWHMWKKKAIENYFGPEDYENLGMDAEEYRNIPVPERYFQKVENKVKSYKKSYLPEVAKSMSRDKYENICDKVIINGIVISEVQLFLLKMAKVV